MPSVFGQSGTKQEQMGEGEDGCCPKPVALIMMMLVLANATSQRRLKGTDAYVH